MENVHKTVLAFNNIMLKEREFDHNTQLCLKIVCANVTGVGMYGKQTILDVYDNLERYLDFRPLAMTCRKMHTKYCIDVSDVMMYRAMPLHFYVSVAVSTHGRSTSHAVMDVIKGMNIKIDCECRKVFKYKYFSTELISDEITVMKCVVISGDFGHNDRKIMATRSIVLDTREIQQEEVTILETSKFQLCAKSKMSCINSKYSRLTRGIHLMKDILHLRKISYILNVELNPFNIPVLNLCWKYITNETAFGVQVVTWVVVLQYS